MCVGILEGIIAVGAAFLAGRAYSETTEREKCLREIHALLTDELPSGQRAGVVSAYVALSGGRNK